MIHSLSIAALLGLACSGALAQNAIDFRVEIDGVGNDFIHDDPSLPEYTNQRHTLQLRIDTDAPPIFETGSLTRFDVEIISWEFWDSILAEYGYFDESTPPFSTDGGATDYYVDESKVLSLNSYLQVQGSFWFITMNGFMDIDDSSSSTVSLRFTVRDPFPEFAVGIDSLPDDPTMYAPSVYTGSSPVRVVTSVYDYEVDAEWPPRIPGFGEAISTFSWSSMLYTEPEPECAADLNGDGVLDFFDVSAYINAFQSGCP